MLLKREPALIVGALLTVLTTIGQALSTGLRGWALMPLLTAAIARQLVYSPATLESVTDPKGIGARIREAEATPPPPPWEG